MPAGKLRDRIIIERATYTRNEYGESIPTWATWEERWAEVTALQGKELLLARKYHATTSHRVKMRYLDGLDVKDRVRLGDQLFSIDSRLNPEEQKIVLILGCTQLPAQS